MPDTPDALLPPERDIVERLRDDLCRGVACHVAVCACRLCDDAADEIERLRGLHAPADPDAAETIRALREALRAFRSAARFDATMEGPKYRGWDISALKRALDAYPPEQEPGA